MKRVSERLLATRSRDHLKAAELTLQLLSARIFITGITMSANRHCAIGRCVVK